MKPVRQDYPRYPQHPRSPYSNSGNGEGGLPKRTVVRILALPDSDGFASGWVDLKGAGAVLLSIFMKPAGWFRLYSTDSAGILDQFRSVDTLPPPTPCIMDVLTAGAPATDDLDVSGYVAAPDCSASDTFANCVDGDTATYWSSVQDVGTIFSVDFVAPIFLASFSLVNISTAISQPGTVSVEVSTDGAAWQMLIPDYPCQVRTDITLPQVTACRFLRVTSLTVNPDNSENPWGMSEFTAKGAASLSVGTTIDPLHDGDVTGILAFNGEDPARPRLYYNLKVNPEDARGVYGNTWGSLTCFLRSWVLEGSNPPHVVYQNDESFSYGNCEVLHIYGHVDFDYVEDDYTSARPRFYRLKELRPRGLTGIGRVAQLGPSEEFSGVLTCVRAGRDTAFFTAGVCYYVLRGAGDYSIAPHLFIGIDRESASTVLLKIAWLDASGGGHVLATQSGIACAFDASIVVHADIVKISGVLTARATVVSSVIEAAVPAQLLSLPGHRSAGISLGASDPGDAPLAWGGMGVQSLGITGDRFAAQVDLGYLPIESPGGSLVIPG